MSSEPNQVYYCTKCQIETSLAKVCPKCHRKTTLQPVGAQNKIGGPRRKAGTPRGAVAGAAAAWRWWWLGGGVIALLLVGGGIWWVLEGRGSTPSKRSTQKPSSGHPFGPMATAGSSRVFGARPKGLRVAPPPPPRICGTGYRIRIEYRFPSDAGSAKARGAMAPRARPSPKRRRQRPERIAHRHDFLVTRQAKRLAYVPLEFEIRATVNGRTGTGLRLGRQGGLLPDPRTRRLRRLGPNDALEPGLRISDVIGRAQARLAPDPAGGLRIVGQRLSNRLVTGWVRTGIGLATFLLPRPPKPKARTFTDTRLPPKGLFAGVTALVRRFRRTPAPKGKPGQIVYQVDSPRVAMRRAQATVRVAGEVKAAPGEVLPRSARLTLTGLPGKKGGATAATIQLDNTGRRCNDK